MEAAPKLPMLLFELKVSPEPTQFGPQLKQYISVFYNEDPESYMNEIRNLESLRAIAVRPSYDVNGVQLLKKYYCQLHFLKSRFPMEENQDAAVQFVWRDNQLDVTYAAADIRFELMVIMYNIGALHSYLGANESRSNPDGMKLACTHFQCAAWAFQNVKEKYHQFIGCISLIEVVHFCQQVCLAQAQECILEKSMLDNRKSTIVAKVAVQVCNYYRQSLSILESASEDLFRDKTFKDWTKYIRFKIAYYKCVSLLFQGQQAEEQQKMGERVAFYQAACEYLEEAKKWCASFKNRQELMEGLTFTQDVVEGKRKAAKNENEFIYHEEVPDKDHLQEVKGAALVKGIPFNINDIEISGPDIFARLVPMEAHEAASLYSEKKAQLLRQMDELIENKDQALATFLSSMQLDLLSKIPQAAGIPQELIDRAAAMSARPTAIQDLTDAMEKLSGVCQDVETSLNEIDALLKDEEEAEKGYQELMGKRPPSIISTDLAREAAKYKEAHKKANESNQTLHRAMTLHIANLKILQQPLRQLQQVLPCIELPNPNIDEKNLKDLDALVSKVEEMRNQRAVLWVQLRESVHEDDVTNALVTKQPNQALEQLFQQEIEKHKPLINLIEQNTIAQENLKKALVETYAQAVNSRRYIQDIIQKRNSTVSALVSSCDSYQDLVTKANKGIEFYTKLETNVSKLLQRIKSACKVQQEEREQMLLRNDIAKSEERVTATSTTPKLKDYLDSVKKNTNPVYSDPSLQYQPPAVNYVVPDFTPGIRPAPLGSEVTDTPKSVEKESYNYGEQFISNKTSSLQQQQQFSSGVVNQYNLPSYSPYTPQAFMNNSYSFSYPEFNQSSALNTTTNDQTNTMTTNTFKPLSSSSTLNDSTDQSVAASYQYQNYPVVDVVNNMNMYYPTTGYQSMTESFVQPQYPAYSATAQGYNYSSSYSTPAAVAPAANLNMSYSTPTNVSYSTQQDYYPDNLSAYMSVPTSNINTVSNVSGRQQVYSSPYTSNTIYLQNENTQHIGLNSVVQSSYGISSSYVSNDPSYSYQQPVPNPTPTTNIPAKTKESNIDLLSGLDFTINQAPLTPQQNVVKPQVSETNTSHSETTTPESNKTKPIKTETSIIPDTESNIKIFSSKPLNNTNTKNLFGQEVEKYEKFVESLTNKTLSGPTNLDIKWKEIQEKQELDGQKRNISVARCYPMKNRFSDILPYDYCRVELRGTKDDYINASFIKNISPYTPQFIVTQTPLPSTVGDFWTMIKEQQVELIFCLVSDSEMEADVYWPKEKGHILNISNMQVSLQSVNKRTHWVERIISITIPEKRESWTVMQLQFASWSYSLISSSLAEPFLNYVLELINLFQQQRNLTHPIVVHCASGIGRSGLVCLLTAVILDVTNNAYGIPDLSALTSQLNKYRKNILRDREHLKFGYECFLAYMKQVLAIDKLTKLTEMNLKTEEQEVQPKDSIERSNDPLNSLDPFWASKK